MINTEHFFLKGNEVKAVTDCDYQTLDSYINTLDAFTRTTYVSIYVIDYYKKNFLYVSENPLFLSGHSAKEVKEMGYEFYTQHVLDEDLELLRMINKAYFEFTESVSPRSKRLEYSLAFDFHLKQPSGNPMLLNHKITPLQLTKDGRIWLALCTVSLASNSKAGNVVITHNNSNERFLYNFESRKWKKRNAILLRKIEKEVLQLSAQGYTMNEIAEQLHKSVDSIKVYKKQIFEKTGVKSITEAIAYAANLKLL